uniref:Ras and Rab interactor 1 n=1 Tax=Equus asinus TaxID=9793 RepID=A0A8C4PHV6_EQUAS
METPGEPGAGPFGAPSLTSFAPGHLESEKRSWYGNPTLASAKSCVCGCLRPAAPPSSPATTSRRALGASPWRAQSSCSGTWSSSSVPTATHGTSFSSRSSSPEPSAWQPRTRNWKPSPIWALSSGAPPSTPRLSRAHLTARCCPG